MDFFAQTTLALSRQVAGNGVAVLLTALLTSVGIIPHSVRALDIHEHDGDSRVVFKVWRRRRK